MCKKGDMEISGAGEIKMKMKNLKYYSLSPYLL